MNQYLKILLTFLLLLQCSLSANPDPKIIPVTTRQPEEKKLYPIAIIGAGAAGTMAVKRAVLNNNETLLFAGAIQERRRSRGNWVRTIDNIPGLEKYKRAILEIRNEALEHLVHTPFSSKLYIIEDSVVSIKKEGDIFKLVDSQGKTYYAKYVVMATGIMDEQPHIQGSIRPILKYANAQVVAYCAVCDGHRAFGKKTAIIGYSEAAGANAVLLSDKYDLETMSILTNGHAPEFSPALLEKLKAKNIKVYQTPILEILGNPELKQLYGFKLENGQIVDAEMAFVSLGIRPNNKLALQLGAKVDKSGLVITDANGETSVPNLFVDGDLRANSMKQVYTAWQQAVDSVQVINRRIREKP
jgi:thioredoxin reductase (NADPH)